VNNKLVYYFIIALILSGLVFLGFKRWQNLQVENSSDKIQVVASFYPLYFFAAQIGGEKAEVTNITPSGTEPHDYELTAKDLTLIENSRLLILNGAGLEGWGENIKQNINPQKTELIVAGEKIATQKITENGQASTDPHFWLSPVLAQELADRITEGYLQADAINREYYLINAENLKEKLRDLDNDYRQGLADCAEKNFITAHAAFGYLASTYGLKQVAIAGLSPEAEPSLQQLAKIVEFAKDNKVKYIFFERLVNPDLAKIIAAEVGAETLVLNPLEELSTDEISAGQNYFTEMQSNLNNLRTALQCQ
jgi:zinc transport system substrate-binding protein